MQTAAQGNALEWEGGSIDDLVQMLASPALAVRVEVRTPSAGKPRKVGEIHMVAGGVYETLAGELRGDDAMEHLRGVSPLSFRLQPRLPNPDDGGLLIPGPGEGTLAERPPAELMRYCELYVLTCALEIWRDTDRAAIGYRKGEIVSTVVNGAEASDRLAEVINWDSGGYRIVLPELSLPEPSRPVPKPQSAPQPAKTMFGYPGVAAPAAQPVAVQTASPRAAQTSASAPVAEVRATPVKPAVVAEPSPVPEPAVETEMAPPAPKIMGREAARSVDPVLAKAAATKEPAELVPVSAKDEAKAEKAADKKAETRKTETRKTENRKTESRKAEGRRTKSRPPEKPAASPAATPIVASKPEPSLLPSLGLGLVVGLALAAIYWIYRMLSGA